MNFPINKFVILCIGLFMLIPSASHAVQHASGKSTSDNGLFWVQTYATTYRNGSFTFKNVQSNGKVYDVTVTTSGNAKTVGWYYYQTEAELASGAQWVYDHGMAEFLSKNTDSPWSHDPGCGNTHTFTRTLVSSPVNGVCASARNVCSSGTSGNPSENSSNYTWSCTGSNGGSVAQCTLGKGGRGGNGGTNGGSTSIFPADLDPYCVPIGSPAEADGDDFIAWTVKDTAGRPFGNYNFNWSYTPPVSGVDFDASNLESAPMTSINPITIPANAVSVQVSGGSVNELVMCPSAKFVGGITISFAKPIVEPTESCQLNWSGIDIEAVPICKIYNGQNVAVETINAERSGSRSVPPNNRYYIKCESVPDPNNLEADPSFIQSEFLQCIRRGELIEIERELI